MSQVIGVEITTEKSGSETIRIRQHTLVPWNHQNLGSGIDQSRRMPLPVEDDFPCVHMDDFILKYTECPLPMTQPLVSQQFQWIGLRV